MHGIGKVRVIIADDHPLIRLGIRQILEKSGDIQVLQEASNGEEAIRLLEECCPDVLILDLQMPVMDGFEALEVIQRRKLDVTVLVLSAYNDKEIIEQIFSLGAWSYLAKDEAPGKIVAMVQRAVKEKQKAGLPHA